MTAAPVLTPTMKFTLKIVQGDSLGSVFVFDKPVVTLGRGSDNDVVLAKDSKTSRHHAEIRFHDGQLWIKNLSSSNFTLVNGVQISDEPITGTADIRIGGTTLKLKMDQPASSAAVVAPSPVKSFVAPLNLTHQSFGKEVPQPMSFPQMGMHQQSTGRPAKARRAPRPQSSGGNRLQFYIIIVALGFGLYYFFSDSNANKKPEVRIRTEGDVAKAIQESAVAVKEIKKQQEQSGQNSIQYKAAQEHYVKGFRDYRQGQYARAMQSFQATLSFYPNHELARKYILLAQRKFDENIDYNMSQGRKYYQKQNYKMCQAAFGNVMVMLKDSTKAKYIEAKQIYDECSLRTEGSF